MIEKALQLIKAVEFSNDNKKLLHKNPTETGLTYFGIYEKALPKTRNNRNASQPKNQNRNG